MIYKVFPTTQQVKESACNTRDMGSIPGLGRFPWRRKQQPIPVFLFEKIPWTEEACRLQWIAKSQA